jgi:hypothetical protein
MRESLGDEGAQHACGGDDEVGCQYASGQACQGDADRHEPAALHGEHAAAIGVCGGGEDQRIQPLVERESAASDREQHRCDRQVGVGKECHERQLTGED